MLEATGERLIPDRQRGELVHAEHLARYLLAAQLAQGRRVLDAACGEGYGSALMRDAGAAEVIAIDRDPATVAHARERYGLDAREGDVLALPLQDASIDLAVSFETIEHIADPAGMLDELKRVLAPGGLLLISSPNAPEFKFPNEFHVRELDRHELLALLRARWDAVRPLHQQNLLASAILGSEDFAEDSGARDVGAAVFKAAGEEPERELYTLALCGAQEPLPELQPVLVTASIHEVHAMSKLFGDTRQHVLDLTERTVRAEETLAHVYASASWRLTAPLRAVKSRLARR